MLFLVRQRKYDSHTEYDIIDTSDMTIETVDSATYRKALAIGLNIISTYDALYEYTYDERYMVVYKPCCKGNNLWHKYYVIDRKTDTIVVKFKSDYHIKDKITFSSIDDFSMELYYEYGKLMIKTRIRDWSRRKRGVHYYHLTTLDGDKLVSLMSNTYEYEDN